MTHIHHPVAAALLSAGVLGITLDQPVTFKSGMQSPVYLDNRRLPYHPQAWHIVISAMSDYVSHLPFDIIAGIETAGIPHGAALAYEMQRASVFVRKQPKDHGTQKRVEGGDVAGRRVLLLEDQITTGGSSLAGVFALRDEGAKVTDCIAITSYGFVDARQAFEQVGVTLHVLVEFSVLLRQALNTGLVNDAQAAKIQAWIDDPHHWTP